MVLGKLDNMYKGMKMGLSFMLYVKEKISSKWIKDLSIKPKTVQLLEETMSQKLHDIGLAIISCDMTSKA